MTTPTLPRPAERWIDKNRRWYTDGREFTAQRELFDVLSDAADFAASLPTDFGCSGTRGDAMRPSYGEPCRCPVSDDVHAEALQLRDRAITAVRDDDPISLSGMDLSLYTRVLWVIAALSRFRSPSFCAAELPEVRAEIEAQA